MPATIRRTHPACLLQQHGWKIVRDHGREEVAGLCPLHRESHPSFYVNRRKQVFYCHGCGRGGGLTRLIHFLGELTDRPLQDPPGPEKLRRTANMTLRYVEVTQKDLQRSFIWPAKIRAICFPGRSRRPPRTIPPPMPPRC